MSNSYLIGNQVRLSVTFNDYNGTLADPTTIVLKVKNPDGTIETLTTIKDAVGKYHYDYEPLKVGDYCYRFEATGAVVAASQEKFTVYKKC